MLKTLGVLVGGIFVGALGAEIFRRQYPERMDKFYEKVHRVALVAKGAFQKGYRSITEPWEAVREGT